MAFYVDEAWLREYKARTGRNAPVTQENPSHNKETERVIRKDNEMANVTQHRKYGNIPVETEDGRFDSKHEEAAWRLLKVQMQEGKYIGLARQMLFELPGGIVYKADFAAMLPGGGMVIFDAKSEATKKDKVYRIKKKMMNDALGIEIIEV